MNGDGFVAREVEDDVWVVELMVVWLLFVERSGFWLRDDAGWRCEHWRWGECDRQKKYEIKKTKERRNMKRERKENLFFFFVIKVENKM